MVQDKPKRGRRPGATGRARDASIFVRLTAAERDEMLAEADRRGMPVSTWLRVVGLEHARLLASHHADLARGVYSLPELRCMEGVE